MQHLDEGTIHAWLDGALDATHSREIETHLSQCASCSAAVAEARGLIAAASRILTALDDVPGGVVPKRAVPPVRPARRQWRAAPWVSGIAAALILVVGISTLRRDGQLSGLKGDAVETAETPGVTPTTQQLADTVAALRSAAPPAPPARPSEAPRATADLSRQSAPRRRDGAASVMADTGRQAAVADASAPAPSVGAGGARIAISRGEGTPVAAAPVPEAAAMKMEKAPAPVKAAALPMRLEEVVVTSATDSTRRLAGCYRVEPDAGRSVLRDLAPSVAGAANRAVGQARDRRAAPAAPAAAQFDASAASAPLGIIRLDTVKKPLGYVVRGERSDSTLGWWSRFSRDTVYVRFVTGIAFTLASKNRVNCPER